MHLYVPQWALAIDGLHDHAARCGIELGSYDPELCIECGGTIEPKLVMLGSIRCHDCRRPGPEPCERP